LGEEKKYRLYLLAVGRESETHPASGNLVIPNFYYNIYAPLFLKAFLVHAHAAGTPPVRNNALKAGCAPLSRPMGFSVETKSP
jgi:hypothetical protein